MTIRKFLLKIQKAQLKNTSPIFSDQSRHMPAASQSERIKCKFLNKLQTAQVTPCSFVPLILYTHTSEASHGVSSTHRDSSTKFPPPRAALVSALSILTPCSCCSRCWAAGAAHPQPAKGQNRQRLWSHHNFSLREISRKLSKQQWKKKKNSLPAAPSAADRVWLLVGLGLRSYGIPFCRCKHKTPEFGGLPLC